MSGFVVVAGPGSKANDLQAQQNFLTKVEPPALKCGGFETQITSTDSLAKLDSVVEGALRRVERTLAEADKERQVKNTDDGMPLAVDADGNRTFKVNLGKWYTQEEYLKKFSWNREKFGLPTAQETAQAIQKGVDAIDGAFRAKVQEYTDAKNAWNNVMPPEKSSSFAWASKDLVDTFTPANVTEKDGAGAPSAGDDFIYTKNLTTVVVVVGSGQDAAFEAFYDACPQDQDKPYQEKVVPNSAKKLERAGVDKDGASLYRVLVMRDGLNAFQKHCRESGWATSDFVYTGKNGYQQLMENRVKFEEDFNKVHGEMLRQAVTGWSDLFQSWIHLKVLRAAVEGNLRYGQIPSFALMKVPADAAGFRKQLTGMLASTKERNMEDPDVEDYFPYVSVSINP